MSGFTGSAVVNANVTSVNGAVGAVVLTPLNVAQAAVYDNGNSGASKTIDWNNGFHQKITLTASCTFTFTPPTSKVGLLLLEVIMGGVGSFTITHPGTVKGPGGVIAAPTAATGSKDIFSYLWDGTKYDFKVHSADSR